MWSYKISSHLHEKHEKINITENKDIDSVFSILKSKDNRIIPLNYFQDYDDFNLENIKSFFDEINKKDFDPFEMIIFKFKLDNSRLYLKVFSIGEFSFCVSFKNKIISLNKFPKYCEKMHITQNSSDFKFCFNQISKINPIKISKKLLRNRYFYYGGKGNKILHGKFSECCSNFFMEKSWSCENDENIALHFYNDELARNIPRFEFSKILKEKRDIAPFLFLKILDTEKNQDSLIELFQYLLHHSYHDFKSELYRFLKISKDDDKEKVYKSLYFQDGKEYHSTLFFILKTLTSGGDVSNEIFNKIKKLLSNFIFKDCDYNHAVISLEIKKK